MVANSNIRGLFNCLSEAVRHECYKPRFWWSTFVHDILRLKDQECCDIFLADMLSEPGIFEGLDDVIPTIFDDFSWLKDDVL